MEEKKINIPQFESVASLTKVTGQDGLMGPGTEKGSEELKTEWNRKKILFAEHLREFIIGIADDEEEQQKILGISVKQFKGTPIHMAKEGCKKCYGRGFTGYDIKNKNFTVCNSCFKLIS